MGGAYFSDGAYSLQNNEFLGSVVITRAKTKEEALQTLQADVYARNSIWDWDKVQIYPVSC